MSSSFQPVTFYVPSTTGEPIELGVSHSGLKMVLVSREALRRLADDWKVLGVYFLLGPAEGDPDRYRAYVGEVGKSTLLSRIQSHARQKDWWNRALLIASASDEFNSAEIGWLEGRLYDLLNNAVAAEVMNGNRPGDYSIASRDRGVLERYVEPITAALRACGAPPDTADQKPEPKGRRRTTRYSETLSDLVAAGLLQPGTQLKCLRQQLEAVATVQADGSLLFDGHVFGSPSAAAQAASGNTAEPGWAFWGAPSGAGGFVALSKLRDRLRETTAAPAPAPVAPPISPAALSPAPSKPVPSSPKAGKRRFQGKLTDLLAAGLLQDGDELISTRRTVLTRGRLQGSGEIEVSGHSYPTPSAAAQAASGGQAEPGWSFWAVHRNGSQVSLHDLRAQWLAQRGETR